jgi:hypothetical protein
MPCFLCHVSQTKPGHPVALPNRGTVGSGVQVGKIRYGFGGANFWYNGKNVLQGNYSGLCTE